jgi:hypothetical protein
MLLRSTAMEPPQPAMSELRSKNRDANSKNEDAKRKNEAQLSPVLGGDTRAHTACIGAPERGYPRRQKGATKGALPIGRQNAKPQVIRFEVIEVTIYAQTKIHQWVTWVMELARYGNSRRKEAKGWAPFKLGIDAFPVAAPASLPRDSASGGPRETPLREVIREMKSARRIAPDHLKQFRN